MWAFWGGVTVEWRERRFRVGWDMRVHEIGGMVGGGCAEEKEEERGREKAD